jgi:hypothetical protein
MTAVSSPTDRPFTSPEQVASLVARFADATLPQAEWTHRAHLTVALWYAAHHPPAEALDLVRAGILRLNAVHGVPTTPTRGYHETITRFYLRLVAHHLEQAPTGAWDVRANRLVDALGSRDLPLRHYSEARLKSAEARAGWLEPDLRPLPDLQPLPRALREPAAMP